MKKIEKTLFVLQNRRKLVKDRERVLQFQKEEGPLHRYTKDYEKAFYCKDNEVKNCTYENQPEVKCARENSKDCPAETDDGFKNLANRIIDFINCEMAPPA